MYQDVTVIEHDVMKLSALQIGKKLKGSSRTAARLNFIGDQTAAEL